MDIVSQLEIPESKEAIESSRYLLTMMDSYTRWIEAAPICNIQADTVTKQFINTWISRFIPPLELTKDRGTQFISQLLEELTNIIGTIRSERQRIILDQTV